MTPELRAQLRAWAKGLYPSEAAVELLIRHGLGDRMAAGGYLVTHDRDPEVPRGLAWPDMAGFLDSGPGLSGSERRIARIVASLLGVEGHAADLSDDVSGLDRTNMGLVLAALAHANGSHEHRDWTTGDRLPSLHPWPADTEENPNR